MSKKVCYCGASSLPGLVKGVALCAYHYAERMWGKAWADECVARSVEELAQSLLAKVKGE